MSLSKPLTANMNPHVEGSGYCAYMKEDNNKIVCCSIIGTAHVHFGDDVVFE